MFCSHNRNDGFGQKISTEVCLSSGWCLLSCYETSFLFLCSQLMFVLRCIYWMQQSWQKSSQHEFTFRIRTSYLYTFAGRHRATMTLIFKLYFLSNTSRRGRTLWPVEWFYRSKPRSHKLHYVHSAIIWRMRWNSGGINSPKTNHLIL